MGWTSILGDLVLTDEQAMLRVQTEDDHRAFTHLVQKWQGPIRDLCIRMLGDIHRGEDMKQETFSRLYTRRREYRPTGKFSSYLWRMALNICYDELRRLKRHTASPLLDESEQDSSVEFPSDHANPYDRTAQNEEGALVRDAIQSLPDIYRTVIILRHYENLKLREIAEVLEVPPGTINSRLAEGLGQLARRLEPRLAARKNPTSFPQSVPRPPEISVL